MRLDTALSLRDGIQDLRHPMADIVTHDIFHEQAGQQDTDHRIKQIEIVHAISTEITRQYMLYEMDQLFQYDSGRSCANSHDKADNKDKMLLLDALFPP